jgi:hypothetical protein
MSHDLFLMRNDKWFSTKDTHYSKQLKAHYGPYLGTSVGTYQ